MGRFIYNLCIYIYIIYINQGFSIAMFDYWSVILQPKPMEISNKSDNMRQRIHGVR